MGKSARSFDRKRGLTKQADALQTNINLIVERHRETGDLEHISREIAMQGDFSNVPDYQTALNQTIEAERQFMLLPPRVRARVDNDPVQFVTFYEDEKNAAELIELGLKLDPEKVADDLVVKANADAAAAAELAATAAAKVAAKTPSK